MYCNNCGKEINDDAVICTHCGVATDNYVQSTYKPLAGFILSFFFSFIGLIVSIVQYKKAKKVGGVASYAKAGIILGIIFTVLNIILTFIILPEMKDNLTQFMFNIL